MAIRLAVRAPALALALALLFGGCDGGSGGGGEAAAPPTVIATALLPPGLECPNGGVQVDSGIDENGNGVLDPDEVDTSEFVCHGNDGSSAPVAIGPILVEVLAGASAQLVLTGSDSENGESTLTVAITGEPAHGAVDSAGGSAPLSLTYSPASGFIGTDALGFTVSDADANTSPQATVVLVVLSDTSDSDGDGLADELEMALGYDPDDADMDDDGLPDGAEDVNGNGAMDVGETDPQNPDTDSDGVCDGRRADTDGNGIDPENGCTGQEVLFVRGAAAPGGDGASWATAFAGLPSAMAAAQPGQQVWVAEGSYYPTDTHAAVLDMAAGVEVYGGFAGDESSLAQRPQRPWASVLNGDYLGDDGWNGIGADNSTHVVVGASDARLDGFTVRGGHDVGNGGGGMANSGVSALVVSHVRFMGNTAEKRGGAMYNASSSLTLSDVTFVFNVAGVNGGAMYNFDSAPTLTGVTLSSNSAGGSGGALSNNASTLILSGVTFTENAAAFEGGAMYSFISSATLTGVTFSGNTAKTLGGAIYNNTTSQVLTDVAIVGNSAGSDGGGIYNASSSPLLTGVAFLGNTAAGAGGGMGNSSSAPALNGVTFAANSAERGGGMFNKHSSPTLTGVTFMANAAEVSGGGMHNAASSDPALTNGLFLGNSAAGDGGAIMAEDSEATLVNVSFAENAAEGSGGGIAADGSSFTLSNGLFWDNTGAGPDVHAVDSTPAIAFSCSAQDLGTELSATDSNTLAATPFDPGPAGEVFLDQSQDSGACVDAGSDVAATAAGLDWAGLTTAADGTPDVTPVDMGFHYDPNRVRITAFTADGANATWATLHAAFCVIVNDEDAAVRVVSEAALAAGSMAHGQEQGTALQLICSGAFAPVTGEATVP